MAFVVDSKKIATNTLMLYVRMGITMVISFFTARVMLQQLGVDDYGLNNLVGSIVSMLSFLNGAMGTAVQRFYSIEIGRKTESNLKKVFSVGCSLHLLVALVTLVLGEIFAFFFLQKMNIPVERMFAAKVVFQFSIFSFVLSIINVPYAALLRAREMFSKTAVVEIIQSFLRLGVLYLLIVINYDKLIVLAILNFGITIYYVGSLFAMARRFDETHVRPGWDVELVKKMFSFISLLIITVLAQLAKTQGIVFLINLFYGLAVNAAYAIAVQVSTMLNNFVASFKQSLVPQLMSAYGANDVDTMSRLINIGTKITSLLLMLMTLPIIFESEFVLTLWLKTPPPYSPKLVALVLIYINISAFTYFHYQAVHASGNIKSQQIWMTATYLMNIVIILILFKLGSSFYSAIYVNMVISVIQCCINLYYSHNNIGYKIIPFLRNVLLPCVFTFLLVSIVLYIECRILDDGILRCLLVLATSTCLILGSAYAFVLDSVERTKCISMITKMIKKH